MEYIILILVLFTFVIPIQVYSCNVNGTCGNDNNFNGGIINSSKDMVIQPNYIDP
jgi:hypothetical protein